MSDGMALKAFVMMVFAVVVAFAEVTSRLAVTINSKGDAKESSRDLAAKYNEAENIYVRKHASTEEGWHNAVIDAAGQPVLAEAAGKCREWCAGDPCDWDQCSGCQSCADRSNVGNQGCGDQAAKLVAAHQTCLKKVEKKDVIISALRQRRRATLVAENQTCLKMVDEKDVIISALRRAVTELEGKVAELHACRTVGDHPCSFPFNYKGVTYDSCTGNNSRKWCATEVDDNRKYIEGAWGYCGSSCNRETTAHNEVATTTTAPPPTTPTTTDENPVQGRRDGAGGNGLDDDGIGLNLDAAFSEELNLLVVGDYGYHPRDVCPDAVEGAIDAETECAQTEVAKGMAKVAEEQNAEYVFGLGDNIYNDGSKGDPNNIVTFWSKVYLRHEALKVPWFVVAGNHDWHSDVTTDVEFTDHSLNNGGFWKMPDFWYKKSYNNGIFSVDMFFIDTMIWLGEKEPTRILENKLSGNPKDTQKDWLSKELGQSTADWKVVSGHHPIWSRGSHGGEETLKEELDKILRDNCVSIYFAGHDHSKQTIQRKGLVYVVTGAGSKEPRNANPNKPKDSPEDGTYWVSNQAYGFNGVSFHAEKAIVKTYNKAGEKERELTVSHADRCPQQNVGVGQSLKGKRSLIEQNSAEFLRTSDDVAVCEGKTLMNVDVYCGNCTVIAEQMSNLTCEDYCTLNGLACVDGWEPNDHADFCTGPQIDRGCNLASHSDPGENLKCKCKAKAL